MKQRRPAAAPGKPQRRRLSTTENKVAEASNVVGGIVEKGFSGGATKGNVVIAPPMPGVVPFPVARHRSDGPHYAPLSTKLNEAEEDDEDIDVADFDCMSRFAHPVPRKQKKGLDLSKWRELVASDLVPIPLVKKKNDPDLMKCGIKDFRITSSEGNISVAESPDTNWHTSGSSVSNKPECGSHGEQTNFEQHSDSVQNYLPTLTAIGTHDGDLNEACAMQMDDAKENEQASASYMDEIDAENSAILQMSSEEILEARDEIEKKLQPSVIEILRKHGQEKLKRHESIKAGNEAEKHSGSHGRSCLQESPNVASQLPSDANSKTSVDSKTENKCSMPDNINCQPFVGSDSSKWNVWASRVEKVRVFRFSLDGYVVDSDSSLDPAAGGARGSSVNVSERDFLRTEGDPGGAGYTIKEAATLIRSMVPGQRAIALQLIASILDKTLCKLQVEEARCKDGHAEPTDEFIDFEAVWAYALGPEPELVLSLRIALDDNNMSVLLPCIKVIQCLLSCVMNENFFNIVQKLAVYSPDMYTAPVFRSKPEIYLGFLYGGFWKYSAKSSNLLSFTNEMENDKEKESEGERTINDDVVVAGQDVATGFIRMGLLERITYLLQVEQYAHLEEHLISVVTEMARHSPSSSNAIVKCPKLVVSVVNRLARKDSMYIHPVMIKALGLLKVLAKSHKQHCEYFMRSGVFLNAMSQLYKYAFSMGNWKAEGNEQQKLTSLLMIEQLSFWRVFVHYGYCISYFSDFFPVLCFWLNPPDGGELSGNDKSFKDYASVSREAYLTLGALARRLPYLHEAEQIKSQPVRSDNGKTGCWFWSLVPPVVELALKWLSLTDNKNLLLLDKDLKDDAPGFSMSGLLWVLSAVLDMLSSILESIAPSLQECVGTQIPWLPEFVPKIGIELVKTGFLKMYDSKHSETNETFIGKNSLFEVLYNLRHHNDFEVSLSSVCCLRGLVQLLYLLDRCIQVARNASHCLPEGNNFLFQENVILENGIIMSFRGELRNVLKMFMDLVCSEWSKVQHVEMFGRGGPAPGVGIGWGALHGGFWSKHILLARVDAQLVMDLIRVFHVTSIKQDVAVAEEVTFALEMVKAALAVSWIAGPTDTVLVEEALTFLVQPSVMQCLTSCIDKVLVLKQMKPLQLSCKADDFCCLSENLRNHFKLRWLTSKRKKSDKEKQNSSEKCSKVDISLQTIPEDAYPCENSAGSLYVSSMMVQWAHQRLPLPLHWFLSPISTVGDDEVFQSGKNPLVKKYYLQPSADVSTVVKAGLLLLLGLESMSTFTQSDLGCSLVLNVPLVWKLHSLSMTLIVKLDVLEDNMTKNIYITLQEMYNEILIQMSGGENNEIEALKFKTDIHENYPAFVETLTEQFAAVSYGDVIYGRQVALYLLRCVEEPVRLAVWKALTNSRALEQLPPINECLGSSKGYLEPLEVSEAVLDSYAKSWISGGLNKAFARKSLTFILALHNLSSFIFHSNANEKLHLRKNLARSLIRGYSRNKDQEGMMLALLKYKHKLPLAANGTDISPLLPTEIEQRIKFLEEACERYPSIYLVLNNLKESL